MIRFLGIAAALTLAACSGTSTLLQYTPAQSDLRLQANVSSVMVQTVTLPSYAASEEIAVEIEPGIIETSSDFLWADQPERAVTLALTANLNDILGTTVGANPWPFPGLPDAAVDVRVSEMVAGVDGNFRLTGQFYTGVTASTIRTGPNASPSRCRSWVKASPPSRRHRRAPSWICPNALPAIWAVDATLGQRSHSGL